MVSSPTRCIAAAGIGVGSGFGLARFERRLGLVVPALELVDRHPPRESSSTNSPRSIRITTARLRARLQRYPGASGPSSGRSPSLSASPVDRVDGLRPPTPAHRHINSGSAFVRVRAGVPRLRGIFWFFLGQDGVQGNRGPAHPHILRPIPRTTTCAVAAPPGKVRADATSLPSRQGGNAQPHRVQSPPRRGSVKPHPKGQSDRHGRSTSQDARNRKNSPPVAPLTFPI